MRYNNLKFVYIDIAIINKKKKVKSRRNRTFWRQKICNEKRQILFILLIINCVCTVQNLCKSINIKIHIKQIKILEIN